ncbi:Echinoderm microtubule-associated protein-like 6 (EMAP-6) (Echinoderm microtubule-associated protein-like 5-like) [Durusdinium trenchii]|uniref:Echinoderm microtubule-associated protein-like 6 (EMAP-6) (Echinoderm microtubule-associated protein-like 5-like) n=1 Tax=Durusdinium trenchii TaxID=1381693 RepID=A0ABP0PPQ0_9DINO
MGRLRGKGSTRAWLGQRSTVLLAPSGLDEDVGTKDRSPPQSQLQVEWAHGYNGQVVNAVHWISDEEFVFCVAALGVVQRLKPAKQRIFVGHSQRITCLSYCPASRLCASGQMDPKGGAGPFICLWRPADCILLSVLVFRMHEEQICSLCFSPDGSKLFSIGRDSASTLAMWENFLPKMGNSVSATMELPKVYRTPMAKVATGKVPAFGMASCNAVPEVKIAIFDAGHGTIGIVLKFFTVGDNAELYGRAAIFPDAAPRHVLNCAWLGERCIACGDHGELYLFEGNSCVCSRRLTGKALGFAVPLRDGLLAGGKDSVLHFVNVCGKHMEVASSVPFAQMKGAAVFNGPLPLATAAASNAGVLVGSDDHHLIMLDADGRRVKQLLQVSHQGELHALALHPDLQLKLLASGATDAMVRFWDLRDNHPVVGRVLNLQEGDGAKSSGIYSMAFNPSGSLLACGFGNGRLHWLRFPQLQPLAAPVRCGRERLAALAFVGDEMLAAGSWDQMVYLFSTDQPASPLRVLKGNTSSVTHMQITLDHQFLMTNSKDGQVLYFNLGTGERVTQETAKDLPWEVWTCPCAWHTMGMWAAHRHFSIHNIKSCRALGFATTGEQLLVAGDTSHRVKLYHFPSGCDQGFHTYDGHAGFVAAMLTVPLPPSPGDGATAAAPWSATHVITAGGDDRAIVQWRLVSSASARRAVAWHEASQAAVEVLRPSDPREPRPRERTLWERDEEHKDRTGRKTSVPGPWVQHGGSGASGLPYAEHLVETVPRRERLRGSCEVPDGEGYFAGRSTTAMAAKNERKSFRQGGLFKGRDWLDSGAIIASVASHVIGNPDTGSQRLEQFSAVEPKAAGMKNASPTDVDQLVES